MLRTKLLRDLWRGRWQALAVIAVVFLGTALFISSYLAYEDLRDSYRDIQLRTHLADVTLDVTAVTPEQAQRVASLPGVAAAEAQLVLDLPITLPEGRNPVGRRGEVHAAGRLIGIPLGVQPRLDQVVVLRGHYPAQPDEVLVEQHFAAYHGLQPGAAVRVTMPAGGTTLRVAGIAASAEYLWVARSRQDVMPSPADFGVLFVPRPALATISRAALPALQASGNDVQSPELAVLRLAAGDAGNRLLYDLRPGADAPAVLRAVEDVLGSGDGLAATPRRELVGIQLLQLDVDGLRELAIAFPSLFLTVGGFIVAALLHRRVDGERTLIGTMLALGTRPAAVLRHYLAYALAIGLAGTLPGALAGTLLGGALTHAYASELAIPFVTTRLDLSVIAGSIALGLTAPLLAAILPARRAAHLAPAVAMRAYLPSDGATRRLLPLPANRLPLWLRLPLRDVARHPWRALATAAGVGSALILIVTAAGMLDSTQRGIDLAFGRSQRYDLRADLLLPRPAAALRQQVAAIDGVGTVELVLSLPVQVQALGDDRSYDTILQGLPAPSPLLTPVDAGGTPLQPGRGGAVLSRTIANQLHVKAGDVVRVRLLPDGPVLTVTVGALSDSMMGNAITVPYDDAASAFHLDGTATTVLVTTDSSHQQKVHEALEGLPGVAQVTDLQAARVQLDQLLGLANVFLGAMLLCGVVLAAAILFNTATLSILERQRELATMRALGQRMAGVTRLVTVENGLIALLGLIVGFPLALASLRAFLRLYSSDLFSLPFWLTPRTVVVALLGVVLVLLLAQWPALRGVAHLNLAEAAKMRE